MRFSILQLVSENICVTLTFTVERMGSSIVAAELPRTLLSPPPRPFPRMLRS